MSITEERTFAPSDHHINEVMASDLVAFYDQQSHRTGPVEALIAVLFGAAAWGHAPHWLVVLWVALEWLALTVGRIGLKALPGQTTAASQRLRRAVRMWTLMGIAIAASVCFFPYLSDLGRTLLTLILLGLTAGAVGTCGAYPPVYLAYSTPVVGALMLAWWITPFKGEEAWLAKAASPLMVVYAAIMIGVVKSNFQSRRNSVVKRLEEAAMVIQLRSALEQAETANAAKTRFLAAASHDLRQPLHSLSLFFASLRLQITKPDNVALLGHIDQSLSALQSQMNTLLDMSKLDAGMVKLDWESFALAPLLDQLRSAFRPVAEQKGLTMLVSCSPELLVNSDREQLCRVLRNLLDNAIKYTGQGHVRLEATEVGDQIKVVIEDTGCGISPEHHQQIFEEFFQVNNPERDRENGLGLGLPIVRRLASLLTLELDLQSTLGRGTTITLTLPRGTPLASHHTSSDSSPDSHASMPMCSVLVLDDEAAVRAGMQALLERMGCEVLLAASIDEALIQAARVTPDIVLADLRLRGHERGITAIHLLRQQHRNLPAIIITGDTAPDRMREVEAAGLTVLHKPVAADALMSAIAHSIGGND